MYGAYTTYVFMMDSNSRFEIYLEHPLVGPDHSHSMGRVQNISPSIISGIIPFCLAHKVLGMNTGSSWAQSEIGMSSTILLFRATSPGDAGSLEDSVGGSEILSETNLG